MLKRHNGSREEDDRQVLVQHEHTPHTLDDDFDARCSADAGGFVDEDAANFCPATLPNTHSHEDDAFHNVELQRISNAPPDRFRYTYIVFYLLGTATMTPWNFFVTAEDYWMYKFRNTTYNSTTDLEPELTPMQKSFACDLTLTASISGTTFLILNAVYGQHVSLRLKMLGTMWTILVVFFITTAFVEVNTDKWQEQFFLITLFTVIIVNSALCAPTPSPTMHSLQLLLAFVFFSVSAATMSGGIIGVAGLFPAEYMTALVSGQALGGIFTALAFILVLAFGAAANTTALIYFSIGSFVVLVCIITYAVMERQSFFKYYLEGGDKCRIICATPSHSRAVDTGVALEPNIREVFGKIYVEAVAICLLYATTLSVYPSVSELMQSQNFGNGEAWNDIYYMPVVNYLFFNTGDYVGRILAGIWQQPRKNAHTVLLMTLLRNLYVPFFLCSNTNIHQFLPVLVNTDIAFMIMILTFAISNGYLTNITLIMAPRSVMQHEKEMASSIMAAALSFGLALGSIVSMIFVQLL